MASLLNTFEYPEPHMPTYASSIFLELRKQDDQVYVYGYYKATTEVVQIRFKNCEFQCKLDDFKKIFEDLRKSSFQEIMGYLLSC